MSDLGLVIVSWHPHREKQVQLDDVEGFEPISQDGDGMRKKDWEGD